MNGYYWWIACNGASCAISDYPFPVTLKVVPMPEQLFGFPTLREAQEAQRICLHEPIERVRDYLSKLAPRVRTGEVCYIRPKNPDPPTHGGTYWMSEKEQPGTPARDGLNPRIGFGSPSLD